MITIEKLQEILNEKPAFKTKDVDYDVRAISLLRQKIPYDKCKSIIRGAEHDVIYLCDADEVLEYLSEEDIKVLADCNVWFCEDYNSLALFV